MSEVKKFKALERLGFWLKLENNSELQSLMITQYIFVDEKIDKIALIIFLELSFLNFIKHN